MILISGAFFVVYNYTDILKKQPDRNIEPEKTTTSATQNETIVKSESVDVIQDSYELSESTRSLIGANVNETIKNIKAKGYNSYSASSFTNLSDSDAVFDSVDKIKNNFKVDLKSLPTSNTYEKYTSRYGFESDLEGGKGYRYKFVDGTIVAYDALEDPNTVINYIKKMM